MARIALRKFGGITGDVVGAAQQVTQIVVLLLGAAVVTRGWPGLPWVAMSTRLWLVRHGATDWSDAGRRNGWADVPLNQRGRHQAMRLAGELDGRVFAAAWTSDLTRSVKTARLAASGAILDPRLREIDFGELEGRSWEECPPEARDTLVARSSRLRAVRAWPISGTGSRSS